MFHINLKKIKEFIIKEVNIIEFPDKCLQKKEKKDLLNFNNFVSAQDNVNKQDSDHNLDLIVIVKLFWNPNLIGIHIFLKDLRKKLKFSLFPMKRFSFYFAVFISRNISLIM